MSTIYMDTVSLASEVRLLLGPIARRDEQLARRLKRACDDAPLHVAEGMCALGRERRLEYEAAWSRVREALACVRAAESVGYLRDGDLGLVARMEATLERIAALRTQRG